MMKVNYVRGIPIPVAPWFKTKNVEETLDLVPQDGDNSDVLSKDRNQLASIYSFSNNFQSMRTLRTSEEGHFQLYLQWRHQVHI
ncbi:hypothetical protein CEXT_355811 [Caerostris extrusa]|uniref:Uncharacterized protein n=1 Tax=Caerostris extrusa TaxID=172846 RepID=A0AAV4MBZ7_CAEEX|nr:hypothetical protein CEXT_355811 [Caerostris extrusa]